MRPLQHEANWTRGAVQRTIETRTKGRAAAISAGTLVGRLSAVPFEERISAYSRFLRDGVTTAIALQAARQ